MNYTKEQAQQDIYNIQRSRTRFKNKIKALDEQEQHCREVLNKEERKCIAEKVELNIGGKIYTGIMMQN